MVHNVILIDAHKDLALESSEYAKQTSTLLCLQQAILSRRQLPSQDALQKAFESWTALRDRKWPRWRENIHNTYRISRHGAAKLT